MVSNVYTVYMVLTFKGLENVKLIIAKHTMTDDLAKIRRFIGLVATFKSIGRCKQFFQWWTQNMQSNLWDIDIQQRQTYKHWCKQTNTDWLIKAVQVLLAKITCWNVICVIFNQDKKNCINTLFRIYIYIWEATQNLICR